MKKKEVRVTSRLLVFERLRDRHWLRYFSAAAQIIEDHTLVRAESASYTRIESSGKVRILRLLHGEKAGQHNFSSHGI